MKVLAQWSWQRCFGRLMESPWVGKVTLIEHGGHRGWVRENVRIADRFHVSSNASIGLSKSGARPGDMQVLELATDGPWEALAAAVRRADGLGRPVLRSGLWTAQRAAESRTAMEEFDRNHQRTWSKWTTRDTGESEKVKNQPPDLTAGEFNRGE